ncbi:MAG: cytochrome c [Chitinophagaceae bacterium]
MKKIIVICAASLSISMFACHKKAVPTVADRTEIPPAPPKPEAPMYAAADVEAGKVLYTTKCSKCHGTKDVTAYTTARWEGILRAMIPKAKLNDDESRQVTAYAMVNAKKE